MIMESMLSNYVDIQRNNLLPKMFPVQQYMKNELLHFIASTVRYDTSTLTRVEPNPTDFRSYKYVQVQFAYSTTLSLADIEC